MVDQIISITFVYEQGDAESLLSEHKNHLRENSRFELSDPGVSIKSETFGTFSIAAEDELDQEFEAPKPPYVVYLNTSAETLHVDENDHRDIDAHKPLEDVAELVVDAYRATEERPLVVYGLTPMHFDQLPVVGRPPATEESLAENQLEYLSWIQILPPDMVEKYGKDSLLSAPAWKVEELPDGAILLIWHDDTEWWGGSDDVPKHLEIPSWRDAIDE